MELDWITEEPIDFEYKQYILLDFLKRVNQELDSFHVYPIFQEISLHLANVGSILKNDRQIILVRPPQEKDDEILLSDLKYEKLIFKNKEQEEEVKKIAEYAKNKLTESFSIAKSLWGIINETISLSVEKNREAVIERRNGDGFFYFTYGGELHVYQFNITRIKKTNLENKCWIKEIYRGPFDSIQKIILNNHVFETEPNFRKKKYEPLTEESDKVDFILDRIIFKVEIEQEFPLEGAILSLIKRKVMNYIFQTVKLKDLKNE